MTTKVLHDPTLDETVHKCVLPSGLTAYVVHKPEFTRIVGVRFSAWLEEQEINDGSQ